MDNRHTVVTSAAPLSSNTVMPANAGIRAFVDRPRQAWMAACAAMTAWAFPAVP